MHDLALAIAAAAWIVVAVILASYAVSAIIRTVSTTIEAVVVVRRRFRGVRLGLSWAHVAAALGKAIVDTLPFVLLGLALGLPILFNGKASEAYIGHGYLMMPGVVFGAIFGVGLVVSLAGMIARLAHIAMGLDPDPFPLPTISGSAQERRHDDRDGNGEEQPHRAIARDYEAQVVIVGRQRP